MATSTSRQMRISRRRLVQAAAAGLAGLGMQPATSLAANRPARLLFIDNLRWLLPVVVIAVHVAVTYGSVGSWFYVEPATSKVEAGILSLLVVLAQSFGMGFFFMVAGYFTPRSYDRKGAASFLKDRALRLGLPLLVFALAVSPWLEWMALELTRTMCGPSLRKVKRVKKGWSPGTTAKTSSTVSTLKVAFCRAMTLMAWPSR